MNLPSNPGKKHAFISITTKSEPLWAAPVSGNAASVNLAASQIPATFR